MKYLPFAFCLAASTAMAEITWDEELYNGALRVNIDTPAPSLVLPMPCGGAMAFDRIDVFVDGTDRLSDKVLRHGQSSPEYGYRNFLRQERLRGPFAGDDPTKTHFYMARYELTELQYLALTDSLNCQFRPEFLLTQPKTSLSWFEAHNLGQLYSEWLGEFAKDDLPAPAGGGQSFVRLPTEVEWEFAARGGEAVDELDYQALLPPMQSGLSSYAQYGADSAGPVGIRLPNPLNLFDMLGNAEEIMFEPFSMNALGSKQGQIGGMITRGGSFLSEAIDLTSAARFERSFYSARTGRALTPSTVGLRFVIGAAAIGQFAEEEINNDWQRRFTRGSEDAASPIPVINTMIAQTADPTQKAALETVLLNLTTAQQVALDESAKRYQASLRMGTTILSVIRFQDARVQAAAGNVTARAGRVAEIESGAPEAYDGEADDTRALIAQLEEKVVDFRQSIRNQTAAYALALGLLADADDAQLKQAYSNYVSQLELSNSEDYISLASDLRDHLAKYRLNPDASFEKLLEIVLE